MTSLLIIDEDSAALTALTEAFLQGHKVRINTAKTTGEALQKARTSKFDVIVMSSERDLNEVAEVIQALRRTKWNRTTPAIAISSAPEQAAEELRQKGLDLVAPIPKPASPDAILKAAEALQSGANADKAPAIHTEFLNAVINSVAKSLLSRGRTRNVLPEDPFSPSERKPLQVDFSAVLALCFPEYQNLLAISFPAATFEGLTRISGDGKKMNASEFVNTLSAETMQTLRGKGFKETEPYAVKLLDTPKHTVTTPEESHVLAVPMDSDAGKIFIQFFLKR